MSIVTQAMICNLQIGTWEGRRLDRDASRKVTADAHADGDAARVNKHLVPKEALAPITKAASAVRLHFYEHTLPWKDNGDRLLSRIAYMGFIERHEGLVTRFNEEVDSFIRDGYPAARDQASFRMGELFKPDDYPSPESLKRRFYINLDIDAVTEAGDFRVQMEQAELDQVRSQMERAMEQRIKTAMSDVWDRIGKVVGQFAERMGTEDAIFRDSTVTNIRELIDVLPGLNVTNDPDLIAVADEVKALAWGYEPKTLRTDKGARSAAAQEAQAIIDRMSGFMNAFKEAA